MSIYTNIYFYDTANQIAVARNQLREEKWYNNKQKPLHNNFAGTSRTKFIMIECIGTTDEKKNTQINCARTVCTHFCTHTHTFAGVFVASEFAVRACCFAVRCVRSAWLNMFVRNWMRARCALGGGALFARRPFVQALACGRRRKKCVLKSGMCECDGFPYANSARERERTMVTQMQPSNMLSGRLEVTRASLEIGNTMYSKYVDSAACGLSRFVCNLARTCERASSANNDECVDVNLMDL